MKQEHALNDRQRDILNIIIISHIHSAVPVGSGAVSDMLGLSSATIRNVMAELEDMGYISKPHTSAGRIPTPAGYRYYVDNLLEAESVSDQQKRFIDHEYRSVNIESVEALLEKISHILSILTRYAGIACTSNLKFYIEGTSNMINMPEFRNRDRMSNLLRLFDEKAELLSLLNNDLATDSVKVHIGEENRVEMLKDMSLVSANYRLGDSGRGSLGVLGPMRMNYSALIPLVDFLSEAIEALLDKLEIGE